jgi:hypothetical protein
VEKQSAEHNWKLDFATLTQLAEQRLEVLALKLFLEESTTKLYLLA